jgi:hypothetical protein
MEKREAPLAAKFIAERKAAFDQSDRRERIAYLQPII